MVKRLQLATYIRIVRMNHLTVGIVIGHYLQMLQQVQAAHVIPKK